MAIKVLHEIVIFCLRYKDNIVVIATGNDYRFTVLDNAVTGFVKILDLSDIEGYDNIMLQITSKNVKDDYAIPLSQADFSSGSLHQDSNIRPNKIFTLDGDLILYKIGHISDSKLDECPKIRKWVL